MFKRFGFNTSTVGHTTLKVLAGVTLMYAEKGDKMVLLPFTLEVLVVMTVYLYSSTCKSGEMLERGIKTKE